MENWKTAVGSGLSGLMSGFNKAQQRQDVLAQQEIENQRRADDAAAIQQMRDFNMKQAEQQAADLAHTRKAQALAMGGGLMGDITRTPEERSSKYGGFDPFEYLAPTQVYAQTPEQQRQQELGTYAAKKAIDSRFAAPQKPNLKIVELGEGEHGKAGKYVVDMNTGKKSYLGSKSMEVPKGVDVKSERDLRKEFSNEADYFKKIGNNYQTIKSLSKQSSPASDIGLVFAIMKMFDPTSVVREGEFATAQNAAGVPDQIRNKYNQLKEGTRLNENQRADFVATAERVYLGSKQKFNRLKLHYDDLAKDYGMEPKRITYDYSIDMADGSQDGTHQPQAAAIQAPKVSKVLKWNPATGRVE